MIEQVSIQNFKSLGNVAVELSPVTVLIGRSGVGKSNFLRAIRFLRNFLLKPEVALNHEGGWQRIWPYGRPSPLTIAIRFALPGFSETFTYELSWHQTEDHRLMNVTA